MIVWVALLVVWVTLVIMGVMIYREPGAAARASLAEYRFGNYWFSVDYLKIFTTIRTHLKRIQRFWKRVLVINSHKVVDKLHKVSQKHVDILENE